MTDKETFGLTSEYRLVLVEPDSNKVLSLREPEGYRLPYLAIPPWTRPAQQIQKTIRARWGLPILVLEFIAGEDAVIPCAVAEILSSSSHSDLHAVPVDKIAQQDLSEAQRAQVRSLLSGNAIGPLCCIGWIDEAISWIETATNERLSSKGDIEQFNAGRSFSLLRFHTNRGRQYWFKATGEPNIHEFSITKYLSDIGTPYVPTLISTKPEWNAWLMSGEAKPLGKAPSSACEALPILEDAVTALARLQIATMGSNSDLVEAGAFDQGLDVLGRHAVELFEYLVEAMSLQTSTKAPRLSAQRLRTIRRIVERVCERVRQLSIPDGLVHGDLNRGNIVIADHCQFIDWSEAYTGHPLISLSHLLLLNKLENASERASLEPILINRYRNELASICEPRDLNEGFRYMSLLAAVSTLYGRGKWLGSPERNAPQRLSYSRTVARQMDRATRNLELQEALCP